MLNMGNGSLIIQNSSFPHSKLSIKPSNVKIFSCFPNFFSILFEPLPKLRVHCGTCAGSILSMPWFSPSYRSCSDEDLMRRIGQGDEQAFDHLYQRYSGKMLSYFYRLLNQEEEKAQDMLQDLFMKLVEKPHLFDPSKRFSTWLYAIASNMVKNEYRSREVRKS